MYLCCMKYWVHPLEHVCVHNTSRKPKHIIKRVRTKKKYESEWRNKESSYLDKNAEVKLERAVLHL